MRPASIAFIVAVLLGCHGSHESDLDEGSFRERYYAAVCEWGLRCRATGGDFTCRHRDMEMDFIAEDPTTGFDAARAEECLRLFEGGCEPFDDRACREVFVGTRREGDGCSFSYQCEPGLRCSTGFVSELCGGTCVPRWEEGEVCRDDPRYGCLEGLVCGAACESGCFVTCERPPVAGQRCLTGSLCAAGYVCDPEVEECIPVSDAEGLPCDGRCPPQFACEAGRCRPWVGSRPGSGERCTASEECPIDFACWMGACTELPGVGASCADGLPCLAGECTDGVCAAIPLGERCSREGDCGEHWCGCADGVCTCTRRPGPGEECSGPCAGESVCLSGLCSDPYASCGG